MGWILKTLKDLTFKPRSFQNRRFLEETGGQELPSQNESLPFKTGELEQMNINKNLFCYKTLKRSLNIGGEGEKLCILFLGRKCPFC